MKPKIVVFLVGGNDVSMALPSKYDTFMLNGSCKPAFNKILERSELILFLQNMLRVYKAQKRELLHDSIDVTKMDFLEVTDDIIKTAEHRHRREFLPQYRKRLLRLVEILVENSIEPIFITQPALYGGGIDLATGVDLDKIKVFNGMNGRYVWDILQIYNQVTREICKDTHTHLVDLSEKMPKNSDYFYDIIHFSVKGAEKVAGILYGDICVHLKSTYPQFEKKIIRPNNL